MILLAPLQLTAEIEACFPQDFCCNCGAHAGVSAVPTRLVKTTFLGIGGVEKSVTVPLPYCPTCAVTAGRIPKGLGAKLLMSLLTLVALMLAYAIALAAGWTPLLSDSTATVFWVLAALSAALVFGGYALRRPQGPQTSWYQPVRLVTLKQRFLDGTIVGYVFAFTNAAYRQRFAAANAEQVARKAIEVRAA